MVRVPPFFFGTLNVVYLFASGILYKTKASVAGLMPKRSATSFNVVAALSDVRFAMAKRGWLADTLWRYSSIIPLYWIAQAVWDVLGSTITKHDRKICPQAICHTPQAEPCINVDD